MVQQVHINQLLNVLVSYLKLCKLWHVTSFARIAVGPAVYVKM
jgi:hypothetical protein